MSTKIGHFEILSELAKSETGAVYKATDPQTSQTVALKAIKLSAFGERAAELEKCLLAEAESTKVLSHPNLPPVYGAGKIDGQFFAAMEYIQGNSIATMLARKEGFSIWDLLDIGRQVCSGLDHARSHNIFHYSLEPAKIMCGWDGTVRILGYGVSSVGKFTQQIPGISPILHYMSPEQIRGENLDARSNLFSLGAMFYEMVTDCKAFDGQDPDSLRQSIIASTPATPAQLNPKLHPVLSDLIMKTLAKNPADRYQAGRELLDDLETCKESKAQPAKGIAAPGASVAVPEAVKAATQTKFVSPSAPIQNAQPKPSIASPVSKPPLPARAPVVNPAAPGKTVASAAAARAGQSASSSPGVPKVQVSNPAGTRAFSAVSNEPPPAPQAQAPKIAVDPMMAETAPASGGGVSFSEMTELPPLQEAYSPPPPPPTSPALNRPAPRTVFTGQEPEKQTIQAHEIAERAVKEIKNVPPRLMVYSIAGAAVVILVIAVALVLHVNGLNSDGDSPRSTSADSTQPAAAEPAVQPQSNSVQPQPAQPAAPELPSAAPVETPEPAHTHAVAVISRGKNGRRKSSTGAAPIPIPGQMAIDSTPQGAQVQIDGKTDPSWVTPFTLPGLAAGSHSVTVSKSGYNSDTRTVDVSSGSKSFVVTHLTALVATLAVSSNPAGANVYIDGKNVGKLTPAQTPVEKGQHVVLVRKPGFLDETTNVQFVLGQTFTFSPALRPLGNVDDIKTVGKMKKLFGGKEAQGLGTVSVKTQPKGAQVAVNEHMLDKESPVDFTLDPGNYVVDITMTGYAPVHKIITVDKGGKAVIDEVLQRQ